MLADDLKDLLGRADQTPIRYGGCLRQESRRGMGYSGAPGPRPRDALEDAWRAALHDDDPPALNDPVAIIFQGHSKTVRYVAITQLLGKISDPRRNILSLRPQDDSADGFPWTPRRLCKEVVVPWENSLPWPCLGESSDPYASNPARGFRLKSTSGSAEWRTLYAFLAPLNHAELYELDTAFCNLLLGVRAQLEAGPPLEEEFTVRGLGDELAWAIRRLANLEATSLNRAAVKLMRRGAGLAEGREPDVVGSSLDHLIGTSSGAEADEIDRALRHFETIDKTVRE